MNNIKKYLINSRKLICTHFLIFSEIERIQGGGVPRAIKEDRRMADVTKEKSIKLTVRVLVPVRDHPKVRCSWFD